jgi:hypothetical protein
MMDQTWNFVFLCVMVDLIMTLQFASSCMHYVIKRVMNQLIVSPKLLIVTIWVWVGGWFCFIETIDAPVWKSFRCIMWCYSCLVLICKTFCVFVLYSFSSWFIGWTDTTRSRCVNIKTNAARQCWKTELEEEGNQVGVGQA